MTTREFQDLRGFVSHSLLRNNIVCRLLNEEGQAAVRRRGDISERSKSCADCFARSAAERKLSRNLKQALKDWQEGRGDDAFCKLLNGAMEWHKYDPTPSFIKERVSIEKRAGSLDAQLTELIKNSNREPDEQWLKQALEFWTDIIHLHDLLRALDETDPDFHLYLT